MYGKVFSTIFEGSLYGHFEATATMMALITLANKHGEIDMTIEAMAARTGFPVDFLRKGIETLQAPDPRSRTPDSDGRRIVRIADHRDWGWKLVNYEKYSRIRSDDERRDYHRQYYRARRSAAAKDQAIQHSQQSQHTLNTLNTPSTRSTYIDVDVDVVKSMSPAKAVDGLPAGFLAFWKAYPHVRGRSTRADALKRWTALRLEPIADRIVACVLACKGAPDWQKDGGAYVEGAQRWLAKRLWEQDGDEPSGASRDYI
jgi:hypothetical protein